jgi:ATP-dependent Clp protease adaptor protein ClpS
MSSIRRDDDRDGGTGTIDRTDTSGATKTKPKTEKPKLYKVLLHNDDYTPFELVVLVLQSVFKMSQGKAQQVMTQAHQTGLCLCGVYTHEVAEQKVIEATELGRKEDYALMFTFEKE